MDGDHSRKVTVIGMRTVQDRHSPRDGDYQGMAIVIGMVAALGTALVQRMLIALVMDPIYRVSTKTVYTFVFRISRLPRGVEISSWTFFNSPFRVDSENIQFFIIP